MVELACFMQRKGCRSCLIPYKAALDKDIDYVYHICRNDLLDDMIRRIRALG